MIDPPAIEALQTPVLGVIFGNRDFFPDLLVTEARAKSFVILTAVAIDKMNQDKP